MGSDYRWTEQVPKLIIIDDHKLFASGLAGLLEDDLPEAAIEVYSEVETALEAANATGPDVALLDYYLPGLSGAAAIGKLREASPGTKVIVISASLSPADHQVSEAAGAVAFLAKASDPDEVVEAIAAILRGERAETAQSEAPAAAVDLTQKQFAVLTLISQGKSNKEASQILSMSPEIMKSHLKEIFRRLDVANRAEAVNAARQRGII